MLLYLLISCSSAPHRDADQSSAPASPGAVLAESGHWYLFAPVPSNAETSPCRPGFRAHRRVSVEGPIVEGGEVTVRFFHRAKQRRLAQVFEGGQPPPPPLLDARRQVASAWNAGHGCALAHGELGCAWATAEEEWYLAQDGVVRRDDGSLFVVLDEGEPSWMDVCHQVSNWMDELELRGANPTQVVQAVTPTWAGVVPWRPSVAAHCLLLSGDERQQAEAAEALLELVATKGIGLHNEYRALRELGLLQRLGKTHEDWLAQAEPTSEHGQRCLAVEQGWVDDGLTELR